MLAEWPDTVTEKAINESAAVMAEHATKLSRPRAAAARATAGALLLERCCVSAAAAVVLLLECCCWSAAAGRHRRGAGCDV